MTQGDLELLSSCKYYQLWIQSPSSFLNFKSQGFDIIMQSLYIESKFWHNDII